MSDQLNLISVGLGHYLALSALLLSIGIIGVLTRRNTLVILMSIELMLNAVNITFVAFSRYNSNLDGQVMVFFVVAIAAAEAAVGLGIAVNIFKRFGKIEIEAFERLKG